MHDGVKLIILNETDFNGEMVVQNYLKRTGREEWARQVDTHYNVHVKPLIICCYVLLLLLVLFTYCCF